MTRTILLAVLACATAFAASRAETTTYVDGNLTGVAPNTGGTLLFSDDKSMSFRTGLATIAIPYAAVTKAELGATRTNSHDVAFYKVWAHHKKTETQFLTVEFKNEEGATRTMTLELAQASAPAVLATIKDHNGTSTTAVASAKPVVKSDAGAKASPPTKAGSDWWGDDVWKTHSNASTWSKPAGTTAPQE
jgi:hypothetical protein